MSQAQKYKSVNQPKEEKVINRTLTAPLRCVRCILPEYTLGINFDKHGVCNYCRDFDINRPIIERNNIRSGMLESALTAGLEKKQLIANTIVYWHAAAGKIAYQHCTI